jgi:hypothetical protein
MPDHVLPYKSDECPSRSELVVQPPAHVLLVQAREKKGRTLQEVADMARMNIRQYQKFESGERDFKGCSFSLGLRICRILDIDPWLFQ